MKPVALLWVVLAGVGPAGQALAATPAVSLRLAQLLGQFARQPAARAHFRETQHLSVLTRPLVSEGTLIYRAPDYLEQRVERPRPQDMILNHGQLTVQIGRHRHTVALADYPQLAPLLDSLRATLAGDQTALEQRFVPRLTGTLADWQLQLTPRTPELSGVVRSVLLQGAAAQIRSAQFVQIDGDEAQLRITPLPTPPPAPTP